MIRKIVFYMFKKEELLIFTDFELEGGRNS